MYASVQVYTLYLIHTQLSIFEWIFKKLITKIMKKYIIYFKHRRSSQKSPNHDDLYMLFVQMNYKH